MKYLSCITLILTVNMAVAQSSTPPKNGIYKWTQPSTLTPSSIDGTPIANSQLIENRVGQRFAVIGVSSDGKRAIIRILKYNQNENNYLTYNVKQSVEAKYRAKLDPNLATQSNPFPEKEDIAYFTVPLEAVDQFAERDGIIADALSFGLINFPFKFRPQSKKADFTGAFNFGAAVGYKFSHKEWRKTTHSIITGYSITNVVLDASSVNRNATQLNNTNNFTALSLSLGYMVENSKVQVGIFLGTDNLNHVNQQNFGWHYQGKPWFSLGFGYTIFSPEKPKGSTSETQSKSSEN